MPLAWLRALDRRDGSGPFLDDAYLASFRLLPQPGGLPVGFAVDKGDDTDLTFSGAYTSNGLGGIFDPNRTTLVGGGSGFLPLVPGGIADALGQMFGFSYPTYQAGLTLADIRPIADSFLTVLEARRAD